MKGVEVPPHVDKLRALVRVSYFGNEPVDGFYHLSPRAAFHAGPETVLELLNSKLRVIPFLASGDDAVRLLTRLNIDWVMAGAHVDESLVCPPEFTGRLGEVVQVSFQDERRIEGTLRVESSQQQLRASDFLNLSDDYYPLDTRVGILLVNKSRVRETRIRAARAAAAAGATEAVEGPVKAAA